MFCVVTTPLLCPRDPVNDASFTRRLPISQRTCCCEFPHVSDPQVVEQKTDGASRGTYPTNGPSHLLLPRRADFISAYSAGLMPFLRSFSISAALSPLKSGWGSGHLVSGHLASDQSLLASPSVDDVAWLAEAVQSGADGATARGGAGASARKSRWEGLTAPVAVAGRGETGWEGRRRGGAPSDWAGRRRERSSPARPSQANSDAAELMDRAESLWRESSDEGDLAGASELESSNASTLRGVLAGVPIGVSLRSW